MFFVLFLTTQVKVQIAGSAEKMAYDDKLLGIFVLTRMHTHTFTHTYTHTLSLSLTHTHTYAHTQVGL